MAFPSLLWALSLSIPPLAGAMLYKLERTALGKRSSCLKQLPAPGWLAASLLFPGPLSEVTLLVHCLGISWRR